MPIGERPLHRDANAQPARPWRRCAGQSFPRAALGGITRFAPPAPGAPSRRPPRVVRRRDRRRADGDARGEEGARCAECMAPQELGAGESGSAADSALCDADFAAECRERAILPIFMERRFPGLIDPALPVAKLPDAPSLRSWALLGRPG
jgi:hypothetical protein